MTAISQNWRAPADALHPGRVARLHGRYHWQATLGRVPFGIFFLLPGRDGTPWLKLDEGAAACSHAGWAGRAHWPASLEIEVLTPPSTLWPCGLAIALILHPSAMPGS
jgi:hypothetical protein